MTAEMRKYNVAPFCQTLFEGKRGYLLDIGPIIALDKEYKTTLGLYRWIVVEPNAKEGEFSRINWANELEQVIRAFIYPYEGVPEAIALGSISVSILSHPFEVTLVNSEWRDEMEAAEELPTNMKRSPRKKDSLRKSLGKKLGFVKERTFERSTWTITNHALWWSPDTKVASQESLVG